jgi:hypothetical protein
VFAQALSRQRRHSLDDDVKLFFTIGGDAWIRAQSDIRPLNTGPI